MKDEDKKPWVVRVGRRGEREELALRGTLTVGWRHLAQDLSGVRTPEAMSLLYKRAYPGDSAAQIRNGQTDIFAFAQKIDIGDLVVCPMKTMPVVAVGRVTGGYEYRPELGEEFRHTRSVKWIRTDIPRVAFDADLLASFNGQRTVYQIRRDDAGLRLLATAEGKKLTSGTKAPMIDSAGDAGLEEIDLEREARDQITTAIERTFKAHDLERLVEAVLVAEGYGETLRAEPGADGGVDILAARGPLGMEGPLLCVQVKSGKAPADTDEIMRLTGAMSRFKASHGLFMSWAGFNSVVLRENRQAFFSIRLWDADDLVDAILRAYDKLTPDLRAELPLKQVWTLVEEE